MSKSKGNVVAPWEVLDPHGADAFRWYYFTSKQPWDGYRFSLEAVGEGVRQYLKTLWNTYGFYVLYANANDIEDPAPPAELTDLDRWALSRLASTKETVIDRLEDYDTTTGGRAIAAFVDDLSNWYVRRSRRRFWDGDEAAFHTLRTCLVEAAKLTAPLTPFIADAIYENLDGSEPSVHLCDFPVAGERDDDAGAPDAGGARCRRARPRGARPGQDQGAPAAAGGGRRGRRGGAGGDRAFPRRRARGAQREVGALRVRGRRARALRAEAQLPRARPAFRQAHARRRRRGRRARSRPRGEDLARRGRGPHRGRRQGAPARWRRPPDGSPAA